MRCATFFAVFAALLLGACGTTDDSLKPAPLPQIESEFAIETVWSHRVGKGVGKQRHHLLPAVSGNTLFAADAFGFVGAYDADSGKLIWELMLQNPDEQQLRSDGSFVTGGIGASSSALYLGTIHGDAIALRQSDGQQLWSTHVASEVLSPPQSDGVLVYLQTLDGRLLALEIDSGERRWLYDNSTPRLSLRGTSTPLVLGGGSVAVGFATSKVAVLNTLDGRLIWAQQVATPAGSTELERIIDVDGAMRTSQGLLFAASYQGKLRAFVLSTGQILWERDFSTHRGLAVDNNNVYAIDAEDHIHAIEQTSPRLLWSNDSLHHRRLSHPEIFGNYLVVGDYAGFVHFISRTDGRLVATRRITFGAISNSPVVRGDKLYVLSDKGELSTLRINHPGAS